MGPVGFSIRLQVFLSTCLGLEFLGTPGQWARYLRWDASTRGDLSFQFKTESSEALLLYFDDGGYCDFLQLSVVDGKLQLHFSIDCAETIVVSDRRVDDNSWHLATLSRYNIRTVLVLDGQAKAGEVRPQRLFMKIVSDLFLGGVPQDIHSSVFTLPTVQNMLPFTGTISDLKYGISQPLFLGSLKVPLELEGWCTMNPCENGGVCSMVDGVPVCDCSRTQYKGRFCSEGNTLIFQNTFAMQCSGHKWCLAPCTLSLFNVFSLIEFFFLFFKLSFKLYEGLIFKVEMWQLILMNCMYYPDNCALSHLQLAAVLY